MGSLESVVVSMEKNKDKIDDKYFEVLADRIRETVQIDKLYNLEPSLIIKILQKSDMSANTASIFLQNAYYGFRRYNAIDFLPYIKIHSNNFNAEGVLAPLLSIPLLRNLSSEAVKYTPISQQKELEELKEKARRINTVKGEIWDYNQKLILKVCKRIVEDDEMNQLCDFISKNVEDLVHVEDFYKTEKKWIKRILHRSVKIGRDKAKILVEKLYERFGNEAIEFIPDLDTIENDRVSAKIVLGPLLQIQLLNGISKDIDINTKVIEEDTGCKNDGDIEVDLGYEIQKIQNNTDWRMNEILWSVLITAISNCSEKKVKIKNVFKTYINNDKIRSSVIEQFQKLIEKGEKENRQRAPIISALQAAIDKDDINSVAVLCDGCDLHCTRLIKSVGAYSPFAYACRKNNISSAVVILIAGGGVTQEFDDGSTPLHQVAAAGNAALARVIISAGARVNAEDRMGQTPLMKADYTSGFDIIKVLIENGANVDAVDCEGRTMLHYAAMYGKVDLIDYLIMNGASIEARDKEDHTPLHTAVRYNQCMSIETLRKRGAKFASFDTALTTCAVEGNCDSVLKELIEDGAIITTEFPDGRNLVHLAAIKNSSDAMITLINENNKKIEKADEEEGKQMEPLFKAKSKFTKWTPLHDAAWYNSIEAIKTLLNAGADVDAKDHRGRTPLFIAACSDFDAVGAVKMLLERGANIDVVDNSRKKAIDVARRCCYEYLKSYIDENISIGNEKPEKEE